VLVRRVPFFARTIWFLRQCCHSLKLHRRNMQRYSPLTSSTEEHGKGMGCNPAQRLNSRECRTYWQEQSVSWQPVPRSGHAQRPLPLVARHTSAHLCTKLTSGGNGDIRLRAPGLLSSAQDPSRGREERRAAIMYAHVDTREVFTAVTMKNGVWLL
jgi:hypothetical protein